MSGELRAITATGSAVYSHILNRSSRIWSGIIFEVYNSGNYPAYSVPLVEQGLSGVYIGNFPVTISDEDTYEIIHYVRLGGSPTEGDPVIGTSTVKWDGAGLAAIEDVVAGEMSGVNWEAYVLRSFKRTDKRSELFEATNASIAEIRRRFRTSRDEKETVITDTIDTLGEYKLNVESDFGLMISDVYLRDPANGAFLTKITKARYDEKYGRWGTSAAERNIPREYCLFGGQILLGPIPDSVNYVYVISYGISNITPVNIGSTAIPYTTEDSKEILRDGTLFRLYGMVENDDQAGKYKAFWDVGLDQLDTKERRNRQGLIAVAYHDI